MLSSLDLHLLESRICHNYSYHLLGTLLKNSNHVTANLTYQVLHLREKEKIAVLSADLFLN